MNKPTAKVAPRPKKAVTQQALVTAPKPAEPGEVAHPLQWLDAAWHYQVDLFQRSVLFLDTLRERADNMIDHERAGLPPLLNFDYEIILDARRFERPANYALLRITVSGSDSWAQCVDENKPPVIIVDPRAGHGPGIGGFKRDSEVGMALHEGHPVYFVVFFPKPCPGQTLADVLHALRRFVEAVRERHAGKAPVLYGNCQAGWSITLLSADCEGLVGPAVLNGSPLLVIFASSGDNITPPHHALNWIPVVYPSTEDLKAAGQRIVYLLNTHVGHLGIFVSASVARMEHRAILESLDDLEALQPGLYEMKILNPTGDPDCHKPQYSVAFQERRVEDIHFEYPQEAFEKVRQVSEFNETIYRSFINPWVQAATTPWSAELWKTLHPMRTSRYLFSEKFSPWMAGIKALAPWVREQRQPVAEDNPYVETERQVSQQISQSLDNYRHLRDHAYEMLFKVVYG